MASSKYLRAQQEQTHQPPTGWNGRCWSAEGISFNADGIANTFAAVITTIAPVINDRQR